RDADVTGVQTCALPIFTIHRHERWRMDWLFLRTDFYCEKGSNDFVGFELDVIRHRPFLLIVAGLLRDGERQHKPMTHKNLAYAAAQSQIGAYLPTEA